MSGDVDSEDEPIPRLIQPTISKNIWMVYDKTGDSSNPDKAVLVKVGPNSQEPNLKPGLIRDGHWKGYPLYIGDIKDL